MCEADKVEQEFICLSATLDSTKCNDNALHPRATNANLFMLCRFEIAHKLPMPDVLLSTLRFSILYAVESLQ